MTSRATAKYFDFEQALSIEDSDQNKSLYLVKIVENENPNHVMKSFTKLVSDLN